MGLNPYIKVHASDILLGREFQSLSDADLGFLFRCLARACIDGGSLPTDPEQLGKLMGIRPTSAAKRLPMLMKFFTEFEKISSDFLKEFQPFLKNLYQDFGESQGRMYSEMVLDSLGGYSKIVNNNREISATRGEGKNRTSLRESSTIWNTNRETTTTCTNTGVVSCCIDDGADEEKRSICSPDADHVSPIHQLGDGDHKPAKKEFPVSYRKGTIPWEIALAWNAMVKAQGRPDLTISSSAWDLEGPKVVESLRDHPEQDHRDAIAHLASWGRDWWAGSKMTFRSFLRKVAHYASKQRSGGQNPKKTSRPATSRPESSPGGPAYKLRQDISGGVSIVDRALAAANKKKVISEVLKGEPHD